MQMKKIAPYFLSFLVVAFLFSNCKKKTTDEEVLEDSFDKSGMLTNYADNVILPNLIMAKNALDSFATFYNDFKLAKNTANLTVARQRFIRAYEAFQYIGTFEYGPSETEFVRSNFNTYPCDTNQIKTNINSGVYDFNVISNLDAKGFPAIDYLLYGKSQTDAAIVSLFDTDANAVNRSNYVSDCLAEMQTKLNALINGWNGGYKNSFISSKGSEIGSSLGMLVNQLNFEIDLLKNGKIGIPLGKRSLGVQLPEKCEAYYAQNYSVDLAKHCLQNIENVYLGRSILGADGLGLDDYLDALKAQHTSGTLNGAIKNQFAIAKAKLALVQEPLFTSVMTDVATVDAAYIEIVKLLVLLKTDAPSVLGIVITYQDGDGD